MLLLRMLLLLLLRISVHPGRFGCGNPLSLHPGQRSPPLNSFRVEEGGEKDVSVCIQVGLEMRLE